MCRSWRSPMTDPAAALREVREALQRASNMECDGHSWNYTPPPCPCGACYSSRALSLLDALEPVPWTFVLDPDSTKPPFRIQPEEVPFYVSRGYEPVTMLRRREEWV